MAGVSFAARDVCAATGGTLRWGRPSAVFRSVSIDSRRVKLRALFPPLAVIWTDDSHHIWERNERVLHSTDYQPRTKSQVTRDTAALVAFPVNTPRHVPNP